MPNHLQYFNNIYHVLLSSLTFPQCPSLISPRPKSKLCTDNFPHVHSSLLFHILYLFLTLPLGKCPVWGFFVCFFLNFPWPQQSHHNALPTLLGSISVWHSSTNCMKLGLQPLLHPISGGHKGSSLDYMPQKPGKGIVAD